MSYIEKNVGKYKMRINPKEGGIHGNLLKIAKKGGEREPELLYVLRKELKDGMLCMDLGANIGYITLLMADKIGDNGMVYAVEPDPSNIELLNMNVKLNNFDNKVKIFDMGISNKLGFMNFFIGKSSNLGGMLKTKNTKNKSIKVKVNTLTNFFKDNNIPELIKMDIEGHEVEVLEGMYDVIKDQKFSCKIVMELHPVHYSDNHSLEFWLRKFLECGFKTKYVISAGVVVPDLFKKWGYNPINSFKTKRGLYNNFSEEHMLEACCHTHKQWMPHKNKYSPKIARFLMIERTV